MTSRSSSVPGTRPPWQLVVLSLAALLVLAAVAVLAAAAAGGSAQVLQDAGWTVRTVGPVIALLVDLTGAFTLGAAVIAGWVLPGDRDRPRVLLGAAVAAGAWTLLHVGGLLTSYALATGQALTAPSFGSDLGVFAGTELGRWLVASLVLAGATTVLAVLATGRAGARWVALGAAASLMCTAMTGHAAGTASHETATTTLFVHLLAVGAWVGGLGALQLCSPGEHEDEVIAVRRFSRLALVCWAAVLLSGLWALAVRMNGPGDLLGSAYVQLGVMKAFVLACLAGAGVLQRRLLAGSPASSGMQVRARLSLLELALMGLAIALAAAMSSSPPPASQEPVGGSPAVLLTGLPLPAAPDLAGLATAWRPDAFALAAVCVLVLLWWWPTAPPRSRSASLRLLIALGTGLLVLSGPLAVYAKVLFSAHLMEHALLLGVVGVLLGTVVPRVPRPLRTAPGERLPWRSALAAMLALAAPALAYGAGHLRPLLASHLGHLALICACVAAGALLALAARESRWTGVLGAALLGLGGLWIALTPTVIASSWFGATGRTWRANALVDQHQGGWVLLGMAAVGLLVQGILAAMTPSARNGNLGPDAQVPARAETVSRLD